MNLLLLDQMGLDKCQLCGYFFETGGRKRNYDKVMNGYDKVEDAIEKGKGLIFWNFDVAARKKKPAVRPAAGDTSYERRFICPDCVQDLLAIQEKRIKGWFSDPKLNPRKTIPARRESARSGA